MEFNYGGDAFKSGIYKITNKLNGRIYIGSAKCFKTRWKGHENSLRKNRHSNGFLQADYNKCGTEQFVFEIIETVEGSKEERLLKEESYITQYYGNGCYNFNKYATSPEGYVCKNPEERSKNMSAAQKRSWADPTLGAARKLRLAESMKPYLKAQIETLNRHRKEAHEKSLVVTIKSYGLVLDPSGVVHDVTNMQKFAKERDLDRGNLKSVMTGGIPSYKGWRRYDESLVGVAYVNQLTERHFAAKEFRLLSPEGEVFSGTNITKFCEEHSLCKENITAVLNENTKSRKSHMGWRNANSPRLENKKTNFKWNTGGASHPKVVKFCLKSPAGEIVRASNIRNFCKENGLNPGCIGMVLHGTRTSHKGWTKP